MNTAEQIGKYIATEILKDTSYQITGDEALISSGLVDSFSLVDLSLFIEKTFSVKIHDSELNASTFDTLDALVALVESRRGG
jgi:acyl carrier protein